MPQYSRPAFAFLRKQQIANVQQQAADDNLPQDGTAQLGVLPEDTDKNGGTDNGTRSNRRKCKHQFF